MTAAPVRLTLLAHSLRVGGAEVQFSALASGLDREQFAVTLVSFYDDGELLKKVRDSGISVITAGKRGRGDILGFALRIVRAIRSTQPDIVYSFLDFPNLVAALAWPLRPPCRIVWGIRASDMRLDERGMVWRTIYALERRFAGRADLIVSNSWAGRRHLLEQGFPAERTTVVPNGIDTDRYRARPELREPFRQALGLVDEDIVVGLIARLDPMKDHRTFLRAAARLSEHLPQARFVCVGGGSDDYASQLRDFAQELDLGDRVIWTGARSDVSELLNAFDIATLTSAYGEGFPNVVGEAMATSLPCVVTDVGDAGLVVGDTGTVVPIGDSEALAQAWLRLAEIGKEDRRQLGEAARVRIVEHFPRQALVERTAACLSATLEGRMPQTGDANVQVQP